MLQPLSSEESLRLLAFLSESGYTFEGLHEGRFTERASRKVGTLEYLLQQTAEPSVFHTLVRWFVMGVAVPARDAAGLIPSPMLHLFESSGLVRRDDDDLQPTVLLSPLGTLMVAADPVLKWETDPDDLVVWPNPSTEQLFNYTIRKPVQSALDLGCGCGVQALGAAVHSESVVATDLNPRATEFTAFNARLNGIDNVECIPGDSFEPVGNRTFDLIVANPPFFVSRSTNLMYCENKMELDLFCRSIAREAPRHLNEGGFFQMICEWVELKGQPWRERVSEWLEDSGCDAWVIKQYSMKPAAYGAERERQRPVEDRFEEAGSFAKWVTYYHEKQIVAIHGGLITMRRRSGKSWLRFEDAPISLETPVGDFILEGFAAQDILETATPAQILEMRPKLADDIRLHQVMTKADSGWGPGVLKLELTAPRLTQIDMDPTVAQFIGQFNGERTLGNLVQDLAARSNADVDRVAQECAGICRKLLERGFLHFQGDHRPA